MGWPSRPEREQLERFPVEIALEDLRGSFTLKAGDRDLVFSQHGPARLGVAVALCALRFMGFVPDELASIPEHALLWVCDQLEAEPTELLGYGGRAPDPLGRSRGGQNTPRVPRSEPPGSGSARRQYISALPAISLPDPPISDGVVSLRTWTLDDVPWMVEACQDPEIPRWTFVPSPYTEQDGLAFITSAAEELACGQTAKLAVVDARSGERLGASGLVVIDWDRKAADAGYWVAAGARRHGVASRALALVARWAFEGLDLDRLELRPRRGNVASCAVACRARFTPDARPVISRPECDRLPDTVFYALRREDFAEVDRIPS